MHVAAEQTQVAGVVTQPDRPAGRGHKLTPSPVKRAAIELGFRVYEPLGLKSFAREMPDRYDLFVLASYGRILPAMLLEIPRLGALNVHPSLLPKYRGATPIQTALRNGDCETGVTIMLMDAGMDTGDVVLQQRVTIEPEETYGELHDRLARLGAALLAEALERAAAGAMQPRPQLGESSVTQPIRKADLEIDWSWPPQRIVNFVRAYSPQPAARATLHGERVKVLRAHIASGGAVEIDRLVAPNRGVMSGKAYDAGRQKK